MLAPAGKAYAARVKQYRNRAYLVTSTTCNACDGLGSISAARDERYQEALDMLADSIGAYVAHCDDSIFICESRDIEDTEDDSDNDVAPE
jgi:hypothetical protein